MRRVCSDHGGGLSHTDWLSHVLSWLWLGGLLLSKLCQKLHAGCFIIESGRVEPRVGLELLNGWSLITVIAEELKDEVLKVLGEASSVNFLEVGVVSALKKQVVEVLLFAGFLEWENALDDDEQDNSDGEHVNLGALVLFILLNLWSHVGHCSAVAL